MPSCRCQRGRRGHRQGGRGVNPALALRTQARWGGGVSALLGGGVVLFVLTHINAHVPPPPDRHSGSAVPLAVAPPPPPPPRAAPPPKPRPPQARPAPPPPFAALGSSLGGIDVGLGAMEVDINGPADDELLGSGDDIVMTAETVDTPPRPLRRAPLTYPPTARAKGITGEVTLNLLVEADGRVSEVRVESAQPPGWFEAAAKEAVRRWRFQPARYQGKAVRVWARQRIKFQLG